MRGSSARSVAAVTGASRGIGRATALALARRGDFVIALARSRSDLDALVEEAAAGGHEVVPIEIDIADDASRHRAVDRIFELTEGYGVDVLVNNAGYGQLGPLEEVSPDKLRRQLEVNVVALMAFTQPFLPPMRARHDGRIVNVGSIAGRIAVPFNGAYAASKFALEALSDALRLELAPFGVRVTLIEPGPIDSSFGDAAREVTEERPDSPYARYTRGWREAKRGSDLFTLPSEAVAGLITRVVETRRPRARYTITVPAKAGAIARRFVPDTIFDLALRIAMRLW